MRKDAYYFHHDSNARHDPKIIAMLSSYGLKGYGCYWVFIEILREQEGYKYPITGKYSWNSIAKELFLEVKEAKSFIEDCVTEFELFSMDDNYIWCDSLLKRMERLDNRRSQARDAALARWNKRDKEEHKEEPLVKDLMEVLTDEVCWKEFKKELVSDEFSHLGADRIEAERKKSVDWIRSRGRRYKNYKSMFKNWLRKSEEINSGNASKNGMVF